MCVFLRGDYTASNIRPALSIRKISKTGIIEYEIL